MNKIHLEVFQSTILKNEIQFMKQILLALSAFFILLSCTNPNEDNPNGTMYGTYIDVRDGHTYKTVKIGNQVWLAENLAYLYQSDNTESTLDPCFYVYGYSGTDLEIAKSKTNYLTYGVLYNYVAAQRAVPNGWHLPSLNEWNTLASTLQGSKTAGGKMKTSEGWNTPNLKASNSSGFSALPGGTLFYPSFQEAGIQAAWWSSTALPTSLNHMRGKYVLYDSEELMDCTHPTTHGLSVRCIKD
jgi:uncharacterized protein (TIGR02145 family)